MGINGLAAARVGDKTPCGAVISQGSANVLIGGPTGTYLGIQSEISSSVRLAVVLTTVVISLGSAAREIGPLLAEINETGLARALQTGAKALKTSLEEKGGAGGPAVVGAGETGSVEPGDVFTPKRIGQTEPGAVPDSPELQAQRAASEARGPMNAAGYPELPTTEAQNFGNGVRPWDGNDQAGTIKRVVGEDSNPNGSYWQSDLPSDEAGWRGGSAVQNDWNGNGGYVESDPQGLRGWIGPAAPKMSSDGVNVLPGGGEQIWIPRGSASPSSVKSTPWNY